MLNSIAFSGNNGTSATAKFGGGGSGDVPTVIYNLEELKHEDENITICVCYVSLHCVVLFKSRINCLSAFCI